MKKRLLMMSGLLVLVLALGFYQVAAKTKTTAIAKPTLTFAEEQAICKVGITADNGGQKITAVIRLWEDEKSVGVWQASSKGILNFSETAPAEPGHTYRMTVRVRINGRRLPPMSVENVYQ